MTPPYGYDRRYMCYPNSSGLQSQIAARIIGDDRRYYQTKPYNAAPHGIELARPGFHLSQPSANNGCIVYSHPKSVVIPNLDAGTSQRRSFSTYKPQDGQDMPLRPFPSQPLPGLNSGYQSSMASVGDQELDDAHFPQAVYDKQRTIQPNLHRPQDGHELVCNLNLQGPYTAWANGVKANEPVLAYNHGDPSLDPTYASNHWFGPSHPNLPELGTGYVSSWDPKIFGTDLSPNSVPEGQYLRRHHNQVVWNPFGAAIPHGFVQTPDADHGAALGAGIPSTQAVEDQGNLYNFLSGLLHPASNSFPSVHSFPQGHDSAHSDPQGSGFHTSPPFMAADHSIGISMEETGRSEFTLGPRPVKTGRVRKPLTPQGRAEAAWNRTNGVCDKCRRKKVKCSHRLPLDPKLLYPEPGSKKRPKLSQSKGREQKPRPSTGSKLFLPSPDPSPGGSPNDVLSLGTSEPANEPETQLEIQRCVAGVGTPETPGSVNTPERQLIIPRSVAGVGTPETPGSGGKYKPCFWTNSNINGLLGDECIPHDKAQSSMDDRKALENPPPISFNDGPLFLDTEELDHFLD